MPSLARFVLLIGILFLAAGCNQSGMHLPGSDNLPAGDPPVGGAPLMTSFLFQGPDGGTDNGCTGNTTTLVTHVHNPEPATMLLWGVGLVGAALLRRKKKINS